MQPDLKARVEKAAKANNRSLNSEIIALILDGFEQRDHLEWVHQQHVSAQEEYEMAAAQLQHEREEQDYYDLEAARDIKKLRNEFAHGVKEIGEVMADLKALIKAMSGEANYVEDMYIEGNSQSMVPHGQDKFIPVTELGKVLSAQIDRRTRIAMEAIAKELDKNGMLSKPRPKLSGEELAELRAAPRSVQPDILAALADGDGLRALELARKHQKKAG